jgi:hypothetical protein
MNARELSCVAQIVFQRSENKEDYSDETNKIFIFVLSMYLSDPQLSELLFCPQDWIIFFVEFFYLVGMYLAINFRLDKGFPGYYLTSRVDLRKFFGSIYIFT